MAISKEQLENAKATLGTIKPEDITFEENKREVSKRFGVLRARGNPEHKAASLEMSNMPPNAPELDQHKSRIRVLRGICAKIEGQETEKYYQETYETE